MILSCPSCKRPNGLRKLRCMYCGAALPEHSESVAGNGSVLPGNFDALVRGALAGGDVTALKQVLDRRGGDTAQREVPPAAAAVAAAVATDSDRVVPGRPSPSIASSRLDEDDDDLFDDDLLFDEGPDPDVAEESEDPDEEEDTVRTRAQQEREEAGAAPDTGDATHDADSSAPGPTASHSARPSGEPERSLPPEDSPPGPRKPTLDLSVLLSHLEALETEAGRVRALAGLALAHEGDIPELGTLVALLHTTLDQLEAGRAPAHPSRPGAESPALPGSPQPRAADGAAPLLPSARSAFVLLIEGRGELARAALLARALEIDNATARIHALSHTPRAVARSDSRADLERRAARVKTFTDLKARVFSRGELLAVPAPRALLGLDGEGRFRVTTDPVWERGGDAPRPDEPQVQVLSFSWDQVWLVVPGEVVIRRYREGRSARKLTRHQERGILEVGERRVPLADLYLEAHVLRISVEVTDFRNLPGYDTQAALRSFLGLLEHLKADGKRRIEARFIALPQGALPQPGEEDETLPELTGWPAWNEHSRFCSLFWWPPHADSAGSSSTTA